MMLLLKASETNISHTHCSPAFNGAKMAWVQGRGSTEIIEPTRAKERSESDEPRCRKSITDTAFPRRVKLRTENLESKLWLAAVCSSSSHAVRVLEPRHGVPRFEALELCKRSP